MKQFSSFVVAALMSVAASAQVSVGTTSPDPSARFEVNSSTQGFLGPRVALTGTNDVSTIKNTSGTSVTPATGLMVYNTATAGTGSNSVTPGLYTFNGTSWDRVGSTSTTIVNATVVSSYRTTPVEILDGTPYIGVDNIGSIELPTGKWEVIGEYACVISGWGNGGGINWDLVSVKYMTYYLNDGGGSGAINFTFPPAFTTGEVTSDALVTGGAVVSIPFSERQSFSFIINNTSGSAKTYNLRFRESFYGVGTSPSGGSNSYVNAASVNRLYAVKIQ
jgi:hypothetical protein